MRFQVPQFINREPNIVGPLTFKQFGYLGVSGAVAFVLFFFIEMLLAFVVVAGIIIALGVAMAFIKVEGRPFPALIWNAVLFLGNPRTYTWNKEGVTFSVRKKKPVRKKRLEDEIEEEKPTKLKLVRKSKIQDLSTHIDTSQ